MANVSIFGSGGVPATVQLVIKLFYPISAAANLGDEVDGTIFEAEMATVFGFQFGEASVRIAVVALANLQTAVPIGHPFDEYLTLSSREQPELSSMSSA